MISRLCVRQSLKTLTPTLFLTLCFSIGAFAQSVSGTQELISFRDAPLKDVIYSLGTQSGLNILFDEAIKDSETVSIKLRDVSFKKALEISLQAKKMQAGIIAEKTIIVFPDNEDNRRKYGEYEFWLPPLTNRYCGMKD
jgi:type II secretory pathway component GspD/PulD (secretin)